MSNRRCVILQYILVLALAFLPLLTCGGCRDKKKPIIPGGEGLVEGWQVRVVSPFGIQSGMVSIRFTHYGDSALVYSALVEYAVTADMEFRSATRGGGDDISSLQASPTGEEYRFIWNSSADLSNGTYAIIVRVRVFEPSLGEEQAETDPFTLNQQHAGPARCWTIMLYMDGDNDLEQFAFDDINEMEQVGSTDEVNVVVQFDPYGSIGHTDARRYLITQDSNTGIINSQEIISLGQTNVGSPKPLSDFIEWAINDYPADNYCLVLYNHGSGWGGGLYDYNTGEPGLFEDYLTLSEMVEGVQDGLFMTEVDKIDVIFFDMCLMSMVEVAHAFAPHARFQVSSPEVVWATATDYEKILTPLAENPYMGSREFSEIIVDDYMNGCELIMAGYGEMPYCYSVIELEKVQAVTDAYAGLLDAAAEEAATWWMDFVFCAGASQMYMDLYGFGVYTSYVDLGDFAGILSCMAGSPNVAGNAALVAAAVDGAVAYNRQNSMIPYGTGISIFIPNSVGYDDLGEYAQLEFCLETGWSFMAPAMAAIVDTYASEIDIYNLALTGGPIENNVSITCTATMDAFLPLEAGFLVTGTQPVGVYPDEVEVIVRTPQENIITLPDGREVNMWNLEDNALSETWNGTYLALTNGSTSVSISLTEYDYGPTYGKIYLGYAELYSGNGGSLGYVDLEFDPATGQFLGCWIYNYITFEYTPYSLQPGETLVPYISTYDLSSYGWGFWESPGTASLTVGAGGIYLQNAPIPDGDYYVGFYAAGNSYDYYFTREQISVQR